MNIYWIYDLPNWQFAFLCISFFVIFSLAGLLAFRRFIQQKMILQAHNDVVSFFMAGMNAIYGITLGLIAVGAWENFGAIDNNVSAEASAIAAFYQDTRPMPAPYADTLRAQMKEYVRHTIKDAWPKQRQGILPHKKSTSPKPTNSSTASFNCGGFGSKMLQTDCPPRFGTSLFLAPRSTS
jgi:hypothetical protein